jgi:predicted PurR-regulated permease PerM
MDDFASPMKRTYRTRENPRLLGIVAAVVVIGTLFFARVVFIPLALAVLFSLLLTPVVSFLERIKLPRVLAVLVVVVALVGSLGLVAWRTSQQFVELTNQLPTYKKSLQDKIHVLKSSGGQGLSKASDTLQELGKELATTTPNTTPGNEGRKAPGLGSSSSRAVAVEVVPPTSPLQSMENVLGPLATAGLVGIFTIFMLIGREDLRNRFIRLAGGHRLNIMTKALDEATHRINRYLFLQLIVNLSYGLVIGTALHFIGISNAFLLGLSAAIFRFLPYVGAPLAALVPTILSLAIFPGWYHALATVGLFVLLELVVANFIEPLLYGAHVGLSALAILIAAVFWTLIWGFPGLVLSTPLTVCLVVTGRYVPGLGFLNILLGDEPVLSPHAQYYQRLLAADQNEARDVLEQYLKEKSLEELYSSVVIPALNLAEEDRHRNELDEETQNFIFQSTREIVEELGENPEQTAEAELVHSSESSRTVNEAGHLEVLCMPARDDADDVVAMLLSQLLGRRGYNADSIPIGTTSEMLSQVTDANPSLVCISALPPFAVGHARALYSKLRARTPGLHIVICLWHFEGDAQRVTRRLKLATGDGFFTTITQVLHHVAARTELVGTGANNL